MPKILRGQSSGSDKVWLEKQRRGCSRRRRWGGCSAAGRTSSERGEAKYLFRGPKLPARIFGTILSKKHCNLSVQISIAGDSKLILFTEFFKGAPGRAATLLHFPSAPDPLFKVSKAPFLASRDATPSGAPRRAPLDSASSERKSYSLCGVSLRLDPREGKSSR